MQRPTRSPAPAARLSTRFRVGRPLALAAGLSLVCVTVANADTLDPKARALEIIRSLEGAATHGGPTREPLTRAKAALSRAENERQQGDEEHARLLEDFGLEWAETAKDLVEVSRLEEQARALEEKLLQAETTVRRTRTLLEETETRRGRARTELQRLEAGNPGASLPPKPASTASAPMGSTPRAPAAAPTTTTPPKGAP